MAKTVAKLSVMLTADTGPFEAGMRRAMTIAGKARAGLNATGQAAAVFAAGFGVLAAPVIAVGAAAVKTAADFEQTAVALDVLTGSAAKAAALMEQLQGFAAATPFEFGDIAGAARTLLAFGSTDLEVVGDLRMLGDLAAGIQQPLGEMAEIFGKARVQGRLFGEDINQLQGRGIPVVEGLARRFGVANEEVKKLVSAGHVGFTDLREVLADLTGEGGRFGGMMERQSRTVSGLWSTLKDEVSLTSGALGEVLVTNLAIKEIIAETTERAGVMRGQVEMVGTATGRWLPYIEGVASVAAALVDTFRLMTVPVRALIAFESMAVAGVAKLWEGVLRVVSALAEVSFIGQWLGLDELAKSGAENMKAFASGAWDVAKITGKGAWDEFSLIWDGSSATVAVDEYFADVEARANHAATAIGGVADAGREAAGVLSGGGIGAMDTLEGIGGELVTGPNQSDIQREAARIFDRTRTAAEAAAIEVERLNFLYGQGVLDDDTYARALREANAEADELGKRLADIAADALAATRTPQEVFAATTADLEAALDRGLLDPDTFARAMEQATADLRRADGTEALAEQARSIAEAVRTPAEILADERDKLAELADLGLIDGETMRRASEEALEAYDDAMREAGSAVLGDGGPGRFRQVGAGGFGTIAMDGIGFGPREVEREQLGALERIAQILGQMLEQRPRGVVLG